MPQQPTILLADDEPLLRERLALTFRQAGFATIEASNALDAWDLLLANVACVDASVVDLQMPPGDKGGITLVQRIRNNFSKAFPIVVLSGRGTIALSHQITKAGADAFLEKENGFDAVVTLIDDMLSRKATITPVNEPSLTQLSKSTDLHRLTLISIHALEVSVRAALNDAGKPSEWVSSSRLSRHELRPDLCSKLTSLQSFAGDAKLSLGDLLEVLAHLSIIQVKKLPSAAEIRRAAQKIVPVRNSLSHARDVTPREMVLALVESDDLRDKLI